MEAKHYVLSENLKIGDCLVYMSDELIPPRKGRPVPLEGTISSLKVDEYSGSILIGLEMGRTLSRKRGRRCQIVKKIEPQSWAGAIAPVSEKKSSIKWKGVSLE